MNKFETFALAFLKAAAPLGVQLFVHNPRSLVIANVSDELMNAAIDTLTPAPPAPPSANPPA